MEAPGGLEVLTKWCQLWARGGIPKCVANLFVHQVVRPLEKENGGPRNISLMESLLKLADGVLELELRQGRGGHGLHWT
eukprot:7122675-Karenia_brevis.AAC.1